MGVKWTNNQKLGCSAVLGVIVLAALIAGLVLGLKSWERGCDNPKVVMSTVPPTGAPEEHSSLGKYRYAAVAADAPDCSRIGVEIMLKHRGSAVDAAIAAMICVGVINMHSTGIGGGHFMTVYDTPKGGTEKEVKAIIAREMAPHAANSTMYVNKTGSSTTGGLAIAVPGEVRGYHEAWQRYGRVPWRALWEPSIKVCEKGHVITSPLATAIKARESVIRNDVYLSELLVKDNGDLYQEGDYIKRPKLARTLDRIADDPLTFYNGSLADDIVADIKEYDGIITHEDLKNYTALIKEALSTNISANYTAYAPPAPSGGPVLTYILNILRGYNFGPDAISTTEDKILTYHRIVEAFKHAYAKRSLLGDEDYVTGVKEMTENLTRADFGESIRRLILDDRTLPDVDSYNPGFLTDFSTQGTSHLSVLAPDGSAVGITSTINLYFGSKVRGNRTGIFFNNEMDDFSTPGLINAFGVPASPSNFIEPGKRPQSSTCPAIVLDRNGNVILISGGAGGTRITTATSFIAMHTLWFGMPLQEAEDSIRFHHQLVPNEVFYEKNFPQELIDGLKSKGHTVTQYSSNIANVHSIHNMCPLCGDQCGSDPCIHGVTDMRKTSLPDGY